MTTSFTNRKSEEPKINKIRFKYIHKYCRIRIAIEMKKVSKLSADKPCYYITL